MVEAIGPIFQGQNQRHDGDNFTVKKHSVGDDFHGWCHGNPQPSFLGVITHILGV